MDLLTIKIAPGPLTTPDIMRRCMLLLLVLSGLTLAGSLWTASSARDAAKAIGRDAEPSVALALRMAATLSDMDAASLADSLTDDGSATGTSLRFQEGRDQLAADLIEAARNVTYGEAEAGPLRTLLRQVVLYQQAVAEARYIGAGDPFITLRRVQWASRVNRNFAIPAAQELAAANAQELERRYAAYRAGSLLHGLGAGAGGFALLVVALLLVQRWLAGRTRRILNPALAGATLVAAAAGLWFATAVLVIRDDLRIAKSDAYDSLHILFEAKAAANTMRSAGSLWLLDKLAREEAQADMNQAALALTGAPMARIDTSARIGGLLGQELGNITFGEAEREAAIASVARLADAAAAIRAAQALEPRDHTSAVATWLSARPGGGAAAFAGLQSALDRTIGVNQDAFDRRVTTALHGAGLMPWVSSVALAVVALFSTAGLWRRLRDYR